MISPMPKLCNCKQQNIQLGVDYNLNTHDVNASCGYVSNILLSVIVVVILLQSY